ncbi:MAG: hypothetical protein OHK0028_03590 [Deltaproteobacteria bacterium]
MRAGPVGTWRVTVITGPVTGTVRTMASIPGPPMVNRIAVTVDGIAAARGRGVARNDAVDGAAEPLPPIVTVTAVVPFPETYVPPHAGRNTGNDMQRKARSVEGID